MNGAAAAAAADAAILMTYCLFLLTCSQFMGEDRPRVSPGEPVTEDELRNLARRLWGHTDFAPGAGPAHAR